MHFSRNQWIGTLAVGFAIFLGIGFWLAFRDGGTAAGRKADEQAAKSVSPPSDGQSGDPLSRAQSADLVALKSASQPPPAPADPMVNFAIQQALNRFRASASPEESRAALEELRDAIRNAPEAGAAASIVAFLATGEDAPTGLPFLVGDEGVLETAPTLRTALMDLLPGLDPTIALDVARQVMDDFTTQDEYAVGLRNLAWNDFEGDLLGEVSERFGAMLDRGDWLAEPSIGFLESFDAAVAAGDATALANLASVVKLETADGQLVENGVGQATFIAMDRVVLRDPSVLVETFEADPNFLDFAPDHRASMLSRLDLNDAAQRELFQDYLGRSDHGVDELAYFAEIFPNGNYLYGNRLITADEATPSISERLELDRQILAQVESLPPPANPSAAAALDRIRGRLIEFTTASP